ncbi:Na+/H+ antiporter NhaC family protein [Cobetia amphilecti]|uniref:Na+/H+ antiporter NhaC family protein n=1 Tax=Cobetia amphilecti TaxID=1055104 RepID=UPI0026E46740|nr:Na+/H+ antiporter NhaC family protein [Cobetia amphilecti]MDO6814420.1 Na+/H+ antiporter NhaC family protein [Cobetia amphilecti]
MQQQDTKELVFRGGVVGALVPLMVLVAGLIYLSVFERAGTQPFWACAWLAMGVGLFLCRDRSAYCESLLRGMGNHTATAIIALWLLAGVFGKLMMAGGLIDGLQWIGASMGATGGVFVVLAFAICMVFSLGTGTSVGTVIGLGPVLYPAGVMLGADPTMLAVALLSGAAFGDNLSPVSDTTIVSSFTQGAQVADVIRTRLPLALSAAAICVVIFLVAGGSETALAEVPALASGNALGLVMLLPLAVVVGLALKRRHIIEAMFFGNLVAMLCALVIGAISLGDIFALPAQRGESTGLIENGIASVTGAVLFALMVLALTQVILDAGLMRRLLDKANDSLITSRTGAETGIVAVTVAASIPLSANAPALLLVGPGLVRKLAEKFGIAPERSANLMDCAVCTVFFLLPWHIAVAVWQQVIAASAAEAGVAAPSAMASFFTPYPWAMLVVLAISITWRARSARKQGTHAQQAAGGGIHKTVLAAPAREV